MMTATSDSFLAEERVIFDLFVTMGSATE